MANAPKKEIQPEEEKEKEEEKKKKKKKKNKKKREGISNTNISQPSLLRS